MSFLSRWFFNILGLFGHRRKKAEIVFLGLDNAGKTTLLHMLRDDRIVAHEPTRHPQNEELWIGNTRLNAHDLGGHAAARRLWRNYFTNVDGIVFLVDATDHKRFDEAKEELTSLLSEEQLQGVPILVLGNKVDAPKAASEMQLNQALGLFATNTGKSLDKVEEGQAPVELFMCSIIKRAGYAEGFKWLNAHIKD